MMKRSVMALSLAWLLVLSTGMPVYADLTSDDITRELICQCGCTMVVNSCDCETAGQMTALIQQKIGQGQYQGYLRGSNLVGLHIVSLAEGNVESQNLSSNEYQGCLKNWF